MKEINLVELLKDCPQGMDLDCTMYDNVTLDSVSIERSDYPIKIVTKNGFSTRLTKYGQNVGINEAKCVIFPKGKTTWEGFHRPFKDGDIVFICEEYADADFTYVAIFKEMQKDDIIVYCSYEYDDNMFFPENSSYDGYKTRLATEEEKKKLFDTIKTNGYKWDAETKTLEKLIEPRFNVGDRVKCIYNNNQYDIKELTDTHYTLIEVKNKFKYIEHIIEDKNWELVRNKFDITTLKPFDKVLVKYGNVTDWKADLYSHYDGGMPNSPFCCIGAWYEKCIPYEGNEHLLGTDEDCDEYYKNW